MARLGEILVEEGIITEDLLQDLLTRQKHYSGKLGRTLVDLGFLTERELLAILTRMLGVQAVDLDSLNIAQHTLEAVQRDVAARYFFMPIRRTEGPPKTLSIAVPDPRNQKVLEQIKQATTGEIKPYAATEGAILRALKRYYGIDESELGEGYEGYSSTRFSTGERVLWQQERKKIVRARRTEELVEAALLDLLVAKGYFTSTEYERRVKEGDSP